VTLAFSVVVAAQSPHYKVGRPPTPEEIKAWDIAVGPEGRELPPGSGTVKQGGEIFVSQCSGCHGAKGEGGVADRLVGGIGSLTSDKALKTGGSFWP